MKIGRRYYIRPSLKAVRRLYSSYLIEVLSSRPRIKRSKRYYKAVLEGSRTVVWLLLNRDATIEAKDKDGWTLLH